MSLTPPTDPEDYPFQHAIRVRFGETDAMRIVHHSRYLLYLEEARVAYMRAVGHPYSMLQDDGLDAAVLEVALQYKRPLRFDEVVDVHVLVRTASRTTFEIGYLLTVEGEVRATGVTVHACVDQRGRPRRLPAWLVDLAG